MTQNSADRLTSHLPRILTIVVVAIALLGGLSSGLARLGWQMDAFSQGRMLIHGPLMICGFLGTLLICLERAVALAWRYPWALVSPLVNAMGSVCTAGNAGCTACQSAANRRQCGAVAFVRLAAADSPVALYGHYDLWRTLLGLGQPPLGGRVTRLSGRSPVDGLLILTIVGERLELSRVRHLTPTIENALTGAVVVSTRRGLAHNHQS